MFHSDVSLSLSSLVCISRRLLNQQHSGSKKQKERPILNPNCSSSFSHRLSLFLPVCSTPDASDVGLASQAWTDRVFARQSATRLKAKRRQISDLAFWPRDLLLGSRGRRAGPSNEAPGCRSAAHSTLVHSLPGFVCQVTVAANTASLTGQRWRPDRAFPPAIGQTSGKLGHKKPTNPLRQSSISHPSCLLVCLIILPIFLRAFRQLEIK